MARPTTSRASTGTPGLRKVTRTYDDGREAIKWEVRVRNGGRLSNEGTYTTERAARAALRRALTRIEEGTHVDPRAGKTPFLDVAEDWLKHGDWKPRTRDTNASIVHKRLAELHRLPIKQVHYEHLRAVFTGLRDEGLAPATQRRVEAVLRAIFAEAHRRDLIRVDPCAKLDRVKVAKPRIVIPTTGEVEQLISALPMPWSLLVELAAYTGLRAGEIAGLRVRHVDLRARAVHVEETVQDLNGTLSPGTPKSDESRRTVRDLDPGLCARLREHVQDKRAGDYVFGSRSTSDGLTKPLRYNTFNRRVFIRACRDLGLTGVAFKSLRHYYASVLIDEGLNVREVAARLGHHDAAFTLRTYVHLFEKDDSGIGSRIAARRAAAQGPEVVPLRSATGSR